MHKDTKIYRIKKGETGIKPLAHHQFITPGVNNKVKEDCLVVIPHCSESHGLVITDEYLNSLGYYFKETSVECYESRRATLHSDT